MPDPIYLDITYRIPHPGAGGNIRVIAAMAPDGTWVPVRFYGTTYQQALQLVNRPPGAPFPVATAVFSPTPPATTPPITAAQVGNSLANAAAAQRLGGAAPPRPNPRGSQLRPAHPVLQAPVVAVRPPGDNERFGPLDLVGALGNPLSGGLGLTHPFAPPTPLPPPIGPQPEPGMALGPFRPYRPPIATLPNAPPTQGQGQFTVPRPNFRPTPPRPVLRPGTILRPGFSVVDPISLLEGVSNAIDARLNPPVPFPANRFDRPDIPRPALLLILPAADERAITDAILGLPTGPPAVTGVPPARPTAQELAVIFYGLPRPPLAPPDDGPQAILGGTGVFGMAAALLAQTVLGKAAPNAPPNSVGLSAVGPGVANDILGSFLAAAGAKGGGKGGAAKSGPLGSVFAGGAKGASVPAAGQGSSADEMAMTGSPCCPGREMPPQLFATVFGSAGCDEVSFQSVTLTYHSTTGKYTGSLVNPGGINGTVIDLVLYCNPGGSSHLDWFIAGVGDVGSCFTTTPVQVDSVGNCDPVTLNFYDVPLADACCPGGTHPATATIAVTE